MSENDDLLIAEKKCLDILKESPQYDFKIGISNTLTPSPNNSSVISSIIGMSF